MSIKESYIKVIMNYSEKILTYLLFCFVFLSTIWKNKMSYEVLGLYQEIKQDFSSQATFITLLLVITDIHGCIVQFWIELEKVGAFVRF